METHKIDWKNIFDLMPDPVAIVDREFRFAWANCAMEAFLGLPRENIVGQPCFMLIHNTAAPPGGCLFKRAIKSLSRESTEIEIPDRKMWVKVTVDPVLDASGEIVGAIHYLWDITKAKEAESEAKIHSLRHEELADRMVSLMNNIPGVVYRGLRDWSVSFIGADVLRMTGYRPEEFLSGGMSWRGLIHPDDLELVKRVFREAVRERRKVLTLEYRVVHRDGTAYWIADRRQLIYDGAGDFAYVDGLLLDITDRKIAEEELKETHGKLHSLIESSPVPIVALTNDGIVTMWNPAAERVFGWRSDEALGRFIPIVPEDGKEEFHKLRERVIRENGFSGMEVHRQRKDGLLLRVRLATAVLRDSNGAAAGMMGIFEDITEAKRIEKALQESEDHLRQSHKIEAIGRLAGGVAHDFNNLLTAIRGYSELLLLRLDEGSQHRHDVEEIQKAGDRASALTRQLLAFSRKQVLQPKVLDLNAVVAGMDGMLRRLIGEDIDLLSVLRPGLGNVKVDPGQIEQVIMNLVVNARDAMPQGGNITIETRDVELGDAYLFHHAVVRPGSYVMLSVSDNGSGMDETTKAKLFEPFFTTKEKGKGTGLGLSTVYGIVKQSGGYIWVYSEPGKGSTFKVYLPHVSASADPLAAGAKDALPRGRETVLVVEDEEVVRTLVVDILRENGYEVIPASDGEEAIRIGGEQDGSIHLILTDVVMPRKSGREAAESLATRFPGIRVIYMSGYTDDAIVHHGVLESGIPFLQKPFTPDGLLRKVREVLDAPPADLPHGRMPRSTLHDGR